MVTAGLWAYDSEEDAKTNFTFTNVHVVQFKSVETLAFEGSNLVNTLLLTATVSISAFIDIWI